MKMLTQNANLSNAISNIKNSENGLLFHLVYLLVSEPVHIKTNND